MKIFTHINETSTPLEVETLSLAFDDRKRGRLKAVSDSGIEVGIQIERGLILRDGTILTNNAGEQLLIIALAEKVSTAKINDATLFARASYHLGNRHVSLQIGSGFLRYQQDYVLDDMLHGLGIHVEHELVPFEPESGAYTKGHSLSHTHDDNRDHAH